MVWQTGKRLQGGKFEIIEILGQGGFGITYKARNRVLDIDVVIKTPNTLQRRDSEYDQYIQQFQEEGRKLARFSANPHPHIVRILDIFLEDQVPCLVMDFIQGQTLMEKVKNQGSLSESECLRYIRQVGDALVTVHQAGFVHRDAHPGNIMIQPNGKAILIDFGIAKNIIPATRSSTNNAANLSFAPYEQIYKGSNASREPNVDVYSLAATFYYSITGKFPTPSMERRLDNRPLIPPQQFNRQLSGHINDAIVLGMALEKEDRPQSMSVWLQQLDLSPPPVEQKYKRENLRPLQDFSNLSHKSNQNALSQKNRKFPWMELSIAFVMYGISGYVATTWFGVVGVIVHTVVTVWGAFASVVILQSEELVNNNDWVLVGMSPSLISGMGGGAFLITRLNIRNQFLEALTFSSVLLLSISLLGITQMISLRLSRYFNPFYGFLIMASTSLSGIGFGWLIGFLSRG
ncbi:MAG: serine/threonine protein kinase [Snowella sp.]|jgi:serine/threonine-protein kinase|nr:MAG: serine/threonine protein kinase [Snowella sp.]